uniref:NADH-ubiquinone oxidoreductase chain 1 n=1 Tax=Agamermis sp. BH-2006 TaxID=390897 RepID=Q0Z876_9BILA|nr:NADH dehydrogenase subunit 1 [Agamermis sp. BH-2006]ABG38298.1 NADH dehydrogenase subunit 1 [Agamermis sp. BH-2006]
MYVNLKWFKLKMSIMAKMKLMLLLTVIFILLSVAFFTLTERKFLSYSQLRLGPNKMFFNGLFQPFLDGVKLFKKNSLINLKNHYILYKIMSFMILLVSLIMWIMIPFSSWSNKIMLPLFIILMFGISSYMMLLLGWSSMNNYSLMGGSRSLAQVLSFEMLITLLVLITFVLKSSMSLKILDYKSPMLFFFILICFSISIILEAHRAPLDLAEGESELVSGYNTEFSSLYFILIFLSEYSSLILMCMLFFVILWNNSILLLVLMLIIIIIRKLLSSNSVWSSDKNYVIKTNTIFNYIMIFMFNIMIFNKFN